MNPGQNAPGASSHSAETTTNQKVESRRSFLFKVSIAINALVAAAVARQAARRAACLDR